jgi:hypothetical protein
VSTDQLVKRHYTAWQITDHNSVLYGISVDEFHAKQYSGVYKSAWPELHENEAVSHICHMAGLTARTLLQCYTTSGSTLKLDARAQYLGLLLKLVRSSHVRDLLCLRTSWAIIHRDALRTRHNMKHHCSKQLSKLLHAQRATCQ